MAKINSYLSFNGNCREAMQFYRECLGGKLTMQTVGESPLAGKMPGRMKACILHSTLTNGPLVIMATDLVAEQGLVRGNSVSLMLQCNSEKELHKYYKNLSAGGNATHPIHETFWGALIGDLTDKFGINWLLHFHNHSIKNEDA